MFKLLGACLILLATTWIGFEISRSYRDRPKQIRQLRSALSLLETEIGYGIRPLAQACHEISLRSEEPIGQIFGQSAKHLKNLDGISTYQCFEKAIEQVWKQTALKESEKAILLDFSSTLGISDREDQLQHVERAKANLEVEEQKAREEQQQYEKMVKTLGILTGALIVILIY